MKKLLLASDWMVQEENGTVRSVTLPDDAMLHSTRSADAPSGADGAWFDPGVFRYRRELDVPAEWADLQVRFRFEGVGGAAAVRLNGVVIGTHVNSCTPFEVSTKGAIHPGKINELEVVCDCTALPSGRWYGGAGLCRPVWCLVGPEEGSITEKDVFLRTESVEKDGTARVRISIENVPEGAEADIVLSQGKQVVARLSGSDAVAEIPNALLWSETGADLYHARVTLTRGGIPLDSVRIPFGIRTLQWGQDGLKLNGNSLKLRGGCLRQDSGILGMASLKETENRRVLRLKQAGFNAVRCAGGLPSEERLNACDKYGMYVMVEFFDTWYRHKAEHDYADHFASHWREDLNAAVRTARNHPCVLFYSLGSGLTEPTELPGVRTARELADFVRALDSTRPITMGLNPVMLGGSYTLQKLEKRFRKAEKKESGRNRGTAAFQQAANVVGRTVGAAGGLPPIDQALAPLTDILDVIGYNYGAARYRKDRKNHPERPLVGTSIFPGELYDVWKMTEQDSGILGNFVWSAWDYLGEAGKGAWTTDASAVRGGAYPWISNGSGAFDLIGTPTALAHYAETVWRFADQPWIGVQPPRIDSRPLVRSAWCLSNAVDSWAWRGCTHARTTVEVYAPAGVFVRLLLNDETVGIGRLKKNRAVFHVLYEPGYLTAEVCDAHLKPIGTATLRSSAGALRISAEAEQKTAVEGDIVFIPVTLRGENGVIECGDDETLRCTVENGELLAFGSADPCPEEPFPSDTAVTYHGRALAVVRIGPCGSTTVTFHSDRAGEAPASAKIRVL